MIPAAAASRIPSLWALTPKQLLQVSALTVANGEAVKDRGTLDRGQPYELLAQ